jgi:hypothetical protein
MQGDMVMMQNGKVMVTRNGETMPMEEELTMADGTKIMPNGQLLMNDGTARMMEEGETMMLQGEPAGAENMSDKQFTEHMEDEELRDDMH